jgi:hypothetical protein
MGSSASRVYLHVGIVAACAARLGAATNWLTRLHMAGGSGWRVGDCVAAAATRPLATARAVAAVVSYGLYMHFN